MAKERKVYVGVSVTQRVLKIVTDTANEKKQSLSETLLHFIEKGIEKDRG